jgi:hypothetical protein
MMKNLPTKIIVAAAALILLFMFVAIVVITLTDRPSTEPSRPSPSPAIPTISTRTKPLTIEAAPTAPAINGGTDVNSQIVKNSAVEVEKISPLLPFEREFTSSENIAISIVIPERDLQSNNYTLKVQVFGINYNTSPDQEDYEMMKRSFIEAANQIFSWLRQNNAVPENIIFVWGDRTFIQEQAKNWLDQSN